MKFRISNIPEAGCDLSATAADDSWFSGVVKEVFRDDYPPGNAASVQLHFDKTCENIQVHGIAHVDIQPNCDRCLESFSHPVDVPIEMNLSPIEKAGGDVEEIDLAAEDLNFAFYRGDTFDLHKILYELLALSIPIQYVCHEGCRGLCPKCGQNLNQGSCSCSGETDD